MFTIQIGKSAFEESSRNFRNFPLTINKQWLQTQLQSVTDYGIIQTLPSLSEQLFRRLYTDAIATQWPLAPSGPDYGGIYFRNIIPNTQTLCMTSYFQICSYFVR
jgi:hypothetical protein